MLSHETTIVDVVYLLGTGRIVYCASMWARLLRIPLVIELVNRNVEDKIIRKEMVRFIGKHASNVIAVSRPVAQQCKRIGIPENHIWLRANPVDLNKFFFPANHLRGQAREQLGVKYGETLHLMLGGLVARKNHFLALDAFERLPCNHRLFIVGPVLRNEENYAETVKHRVKFSKTSDNITIIAEFVDDVTKFLYAADSLWLPSKEEGLANVMLEALCCGVPCILNRNLGFNDHVIDLRNGYNASPNSSDWANAVLKLEPLIQDFDLRRKISSVASKFYDSATIDQKIFDIITGAGKGKTN